MAFLQLLAEELDHPVAADFGTDIARHPRQIGAGAIFIVRKLADIGELSGKVSSERQVVQGAQRER